MSTAIVVDCRTRGVDVFSSSVTQTEAGGLVLRKAARLGGISEVFGRVGEIPHTVILLGGYSAQSSAGFVEVVRPAHHFPRWLAGGAGLGYNGWDAEGLPVRRGDGLRPITGRDGGRIAATVISGGCTCTPLGGNKNSNPATATAAVAGFALRAEMRGEVVVIEGQSDHVSGWAFKAAQASNGLGDRFPAEHRPEVFDGGRPSVEQGVSEDLPPQPAVRRVRRLSLANASDNDEFVEVPTDA